MDNILFLKSTVHFYNESLFVHEEAAIPRDPYQLSRYHLQCPELFP
jgi:hypothetical protein